MLSFKVESNWNQVEIIFYSLYYSNPKTLKQIGWQGWDEISTFIIADGTVTKYDLSKGNESTVPIKIINTQNYYSAIPLLKI